MTPDLPPASADQPIDGVAPPTSPQERTAPKVNENPLVMPAVTRMKRVLIVCGSFAYGVYVLWCIILLSLLPTTDAAVRPLVGLGLLTLLVGASVFILIAGIFLKRIGVADVAPEVRQWGLLKTILVVVPGILLSGVVAFMITREPALTIDILEPRLSEEFVAPVSVTLSAEKATEVLQQLGYRPVSYSWDTDGDGQPNDQTVVPRLTVLYERQGSYTVAVRVQLDDGTFKRLARRVVIPQAVFSLIPAKPVIEKPVRFSLQHLLTDPRQLREVQWDFDGDQQVDVTAKTPDAVHTYYALGPVEVTAVVLLQNNTQTTFKRRIEVIEPAPLPFPVQLVSEPRTLVSPAPFGVFFSIQTEEPLREIEWSFGDGTVERGQDLRRVGHSYETTGIYSVIARVRSATGELAELTTVVKITPTLSLSDLRFTGEPPVDRDGIKGEVPLTVRLTPRTAVPLVKFEWEVEPGISAQATGASLTAVFREQGTYTITLLAQDPEGKAFRMPIQVEALPPAGEAVITMRPEGGTAPLRVTFDASETFVPAGEEVAGFRWLFGDEQSQREGQVGAARIEHTYTTPGEYDVRLTIIFTSGKTLQAERTIVIRRPALRACFTASRLSVRTGKGIEFDSSCSAGTPTSYLWDVRYDAQPDVVLAQSTEANYIHVFEIPGEHTVSLTVKDRWGNEDSQEISISVEP